MAAAKRRSMSDLLREQKAIEDADAASPDASAALAVAEPTVSALTRSPSAPTVFSASAVPDPHSPAGAGQLTDVEADDLRRCELALDNLRLAFAAAGKALATIRDARLYRQTHDTFESYAEQRWHISRTQAYRLIDAWPLAARLSPIGDTLTESQVRELLPLAGRHGQEAAVTVYQTVAETDGVRITAAVLRAVAGLLANGDFDPDEATSKIRAYLAADHEVPSNAPDPAQAVISVSGRLVRRLHQLASADPDAVRQALGSLREALDEIERELS